jgi:NAD(P)-dependent dehydrogenase (short-subunit alcohol dehydrogenase family)
MNAWSLEATRAVVTGASRGIGAAIVAEMLSLGASVLGVSRSREDLAHLQVENASRDRLHILSADLTDASQRSLVISEAQERLGGIDVLVNNAGVAFRAPAGEADVDQFRRVLDLNLIAAFDLSRLAYGVLRAAGRSNIINISSVAGVATLPQRAFYGASKAALNHLTQSLAAEWGRDRIRVNAVLPWFTRTPMAASVLLKRRVVPPDSGSDTVTTRCGARGRRTHGGFPLHACIELHYWPIARRGRRLPGARTKTDDRPPRV